MLPPRNVEWKDVEGCRIDIKWKVEEGCGIRKRKTRGACNFSYNFSYNFSLFLHVSCLNIRCLANTLAHFLLGEEVGKNLSLSPNFSVRPVSPSDQDVVLHS